MDVKIAPSVLSADFVNLERDIQLVQTADLLHIDVMDYHFVPNLTFGEDAVARMIEVSPIPCDVHLMIENTDRWAVNYARMGAASVTFHWGTIQDPVDLARRIHDAGARAAIAIKPQESLAPILEIANHFDMVLVMTVEPGFGGQAFMADMLSKVRTLRDFVSDNFLSLDIEVDGGIDSATIQSAARAGANVFVAGSAIYSSKRPASMIAKLRKMAESAQ
jgi:ribulose-phosphate 3-epimerase